MALNKRTFLTLAAIALLASSVSAAGPGIGSPAPNFTLPDSAGVNRSLTSYRGRVVMLNFWASW